MHDGELFAVYSISPHRVLRIRGNHAEWAYASSARFPWRGGELRGGAPPVRAGDEYWSFFHDRITLRGRLTYRMGLYTFDASPPFRPRRMIPYPLLVGDRRTNHGYCPHDVIFPCGAIRREDEWIVSCGVHDRWIELHTFEHRELERQLVELRHGND